MIEIHLPMLEPPGQKGLIPGSESSLGVGNGNLLSVFLPVSWTDEPDGLLIHGGHMGWT